MESQSPRRRGRQKRPRVPESLRRRAARACLPCRQHKEKCQGGVPCTRCQQHDRSCHFDDVRPRPASLLPSHASNRERQMERIIRHFLGDDISFDPVRLEETADSLETGRHVATREPPELEDQDTISDSYSLEPLSTSTMHYSGELSHWNFSKLIQLTDGFFRATGLQSTSSCIASSTVYFPPRNVAEFLTNTFLQYAQTNYFYFDEKIFREKMEFYYNIDRPLVIDDAGWICTLLMTFAVGTQFAYMQTAPTQGNPPFSEEIPDDRIGLELYRFSCRLIPDLITIASVETVQAFMLLGVYTLPIDTAGLGYTYWGLAIKMAVQNGMHRKLCTPEVPLATAEWRNRLWWSAFSLESRISILHGRPVSVSPSDTDADMPTDRPDMNPPDGISNLPNVIANIHVTRHLGKIAQVILRLRRCPRSHQGTYLHQLRTMRQELRTWWDSLPTAIHCHDLSPEGLFFRQNVHLELNFATGTIYMGRPFIFLEKTPHSSKEADTKAENRVELVHTLSEDCAQAAVRIIDLCQLLQDSVGLARVSYTEFSSCRAALLALIAHRLTQSSERTCNALTRGMTLIRQMSVGLESARSEVAVIEALERARQQLDRRSEEGALAVPSDSGYDQFQTWAKLWRLGPLGSDPLLTLDDVETPENPGSLPSFDGFFSSFPQELNAFAAIPGTDDAAAPPSIWPDPDGLFSIPDNGDPFWDVSGAL
ncbi:hypothetical protein FE257_004427 [Aspergillus nanangensis]|uniref:Zn(2)-C6 fungal-type domain-containing protein n=1 Tax=Aspergillus nanangensis TaxID=2582783 RepID=A0AAD4GZC1_ASPNN|nr:hypothetical protein FE257_004427 [Aspergillus nanangensis]